MAEDVEHWTVSSLLLDDKYDWNEQVVRSTFNPLIAVEILKIKLSPTPKPDQWIWGGEKSNKFGMKSAYRTTQSIKQRAQG